MNERARNLKEILKNIIANEEESKEFEKLKTISEIYEKCIAKGYKGGMEEFTSDLMTLELLPKEMIKIIEEKLNEVSGGKLDAKKGIASILSGLTVMSAGGININAAPVSKEASKKASVSSRKNSLLDKLNNSALNKVDQKAAGIGAGIFTVGAVGGYILRGLINSNSDYIKFLKEIEQFRNKTKDSNLHSATNLLENIIMPSNIDNALNLIFEKGNNSSNDRRPTSLSYNNWIATDGNNALDGLIGDVSKKKFQIGSNNNKDASSNDDIKAFFGCVDDISEELRAYGRSNLNFHTTFIEILKDKEFSKEKSRNFMKEIYAMQSSINSAISIIKSSIKSSDSEKKKKEEAIKNLTEFNNLLSSFENYLYNKVMNM